MFEVHRRQHPRAMLMKYEVLKTTFFDVIHAEEAGITVMWDRGTRLRVQLHPRFKGKLNVVS